MDIKKQQFPVCQMMFLNLKYLSLIIECKHTVGFWGIKASGNLQKAVQKGDVEMEKMKMETIDIVSHNVAQLGKLFPNCVSEIIDSNGSRKLAVNMEVLQIGRASCRERV